MVLDDENPQRHRGSPRLESGQWGLGAAAAKCLANNLHSVERGYERITFDGMNSEG
jgi:hypothetical protein